MQLLPALTKPPRVYCVPVAWHDLAPLYEATIASSIRQPHSNQTRHAHNKARNHFLGRNLWQQARNNWTAESKSVGRNSLAEWLLCCMEWFWVLKLLGKQTFYQPFFFNNLILGITFLESPFTTNNCQNQSKLTIINVTLFSKLLQR